MSYLAFSGLNFWYLIVYLNKIFKKVMETSWKDINGVSVKYIKEYYYYEANSGSVNFDLVCMGVFLVLQFFFWLVVIKKMYQFEIDFE